MISQRKIGWFFVMLMAVLTVPLSAQDSLPPAPYAYNQLDDPRLESEATALMHSLRCLKCQSQSIADSDAPMAGDMRHQVRSRILAGESPSEIRSWLIARYGDYVSYEPEVSATTWPLFAGPIVLLLIVAGVLLRRLGKRRCDAGDAA
ncbi:MAG: cytochrome c-type biogenesis protein CcmH [Sphingomonadales bacterium]|nr:cytochrome c-type biogenesis protein CcmH [Sphingomonadales bacterium]NCQ21725.1 cytochrome c-type biogenesis protein CcmH [Sphingomonadales bacterium]NCT04437.1 cytochrome c-type biogenesis protein CcmH [Sphingomonadales bacterium]